MPSKQTLIDNHKTSASILAMAVADLGIRPQLSSVRVDSSGFKHVVACLAANENDSFDGVGATIKEALADCISRRFPS